MSSFSILFLFVAIITLLFLAINFILAPRSPYPAKLSPFECGFQSFHQTRSPFHLSFFMHALVYLILDLEIILLYPYAMSTYVNGIYGLVIMLLFTFVISVGFVYELGSGALHIDSRQYNAISKGSLGSSKLHASFGRFPLLTLRKIHDNILKMLNSTTLGFLLISLCLTFVTSYFGVSVIMLEICSFGVILWFLLYNYGLEFFRQFPPRIFLNTIENVFKNNLLQKFIYTGIILALFTYCPPLFNTLLSFILNLVIHYKFVRILYKFSTNKNKKLVYKDCEDYMKFILNINLFGLIYFSYTAILPDNFLLSTPSLNPESNSPHNSNNPAESPGNGGGGDGGGAQPNGSDGGIPNGTFSDPGDAIIEKSEARINDSELNRETNIFNNSGKSHDFTESEKEYIVKIRNDDIPTESRDYCIRKTESPSGNNGTELSESGLAANRGDCLERNADGGGYNESHLYGSVKNTEADLNELIEVVHTHQNRTNE